MYLAVERLYSDRGMHNMPIVPKKHPVFSFKYELKERGKELGNLVCTS